MWEELLPGAWDPSDGISFSGIGTIINRVMLSKVSRCIVLGSGVGYGPAPDGFGNGRWKVLSVRGPISARVLGLDASLALTDAAIALSAIDRFRQPPSKSGSDIVFMPHAYSERTGHWEEVCKAAGVKYLSPEADSKVAVETIRSARFVLADAMHAAIVADTLRVPWIPLSSSVHNNTFKWLDWTLSLGLPYKPVILPPTSSLELLRTYTLPLCAEDYRVTPATAEAAINDHSRKSRLNSSRYWKSYAGMASKLLISLPQVVYNSNGFSALRARDRNLYIDKAASALQLAAQGTQYLSGEKIFALRSEQMQEKVHAIPRIINDWSHTA
jgi:succinoglycan biosynthesis protein ExoV